MKYIQRILASLAIVCMLCSCAAKQPAADLLNLFEKQLVNFPADVSVYVMKSDGHRIILNQESFPMFSVVKFPLALTVCDTLRKQGRSLEEQIWVSADDLHPDTWSPMREKYPDGSYLSYAELLDYALTQSDNNACDILFSQVGGPRKVEDFLNGIFTDTFVANCAIRHTEAEMHDSLGRCYENGMNCEAAGQLLEWFYNERNKDEYAKFLWSTMARCQTGESRIPKYIKDNVATIVHKTGTGPLTPDGKIMGINDIACIEFPDGRHCLLAVFIKDASCGIEQCEELIAQIAKQVVQSELGK